MRIRDETSDGAENGEGFNLQVRRSWDDIRFVERDVRIILLVYVQIFNETLAQEVVECETPAFELL